MVLREQLDPARFSPCLLWSSALYRPLRLALTSSLHTELPHPNLGFDARNANILCHQRSGWLLGSILARQDTDFRVRSSSLVDGNQLNALRRPPALSSLRTNPVRAAAFERSQEHTQITAETRWRHEEWRICCVWVEGEKKRRGLFMVRW